jgi:hypothetical protein
MCIQFWRSPLPMNLDLDGARLCLGDGAPGAAGGKKRSPQTHPNQPIWRTRWRVCANGSHPHFRGTKLTGAAQEHYAAIHWARGEMANRSKEPQLCLFAERIRDTAGGPTRSGCCYRVLPLCGWNACGRSGWLEPNWLNRRRPLHLTPTQSSPAACW